MVYLANSQIHLADTPVAIDVKGVVHDFGQSEMLREISLGFSKGLKCVVMFCLTYFSNTIVELVVELRMVYGTDVNL